MGRQRREFVPGAIYHVMNRGNHKEPIFYDDHDRRRFEEIWNRHASLYGVRTLGRCLMSNHFHGVIETAHANLDDFMEQVEGQFARYSNWRHKRTGHLFQGRYRLVEITDDTHLITALCYVFLNPVSAGLVNRAEQYRWSTYAATAGIAPTPNWLSLEWLQSLFPAGSLKDSQRWLHAVMSQECPARAYAEQIELHVSPDAVKRTIHSYTAGQFRLDAFPRVYRTALRPSLQELIDEHREDCGQFAHHARVTYGYRNAEIASVLTISSTAAYKLCTAYRRSNKLVPGTN